MHFVYVSRFCLCYVIVFPITPQQVFHLFCFQFFCTSKSSQVLFFCLVYSSNTLVKNIVVVRPKNETRAFWRITFWRINLRTQYSFKHIFVLCPYIVVVSRPLSQSFLIPLERSTLVENKFERLVQTRFRAKYHV